VKGTKTVTVIILLLIAFFALLIVFNFIPDNIKNIFQRFKPQGQEQVPPGGSNSAAPRPEGASPRGGGGEAPQRGDGAAPRGGDGSAPRTGGGGAASGGTRNATTVRVTPVFTDTIERSVIINGEILARNQVTIYPTIGGRLVELFFGIGDRVSRGAVVAMIDPSRPGEVFSRNPVTATVAGTVLQVPFNIGDTVSTQSAVLVVGDLSSLLIETNIQERFVTSVTLGMRAQLRFEAIPGETFPAEVIEINPVLDPASRTLRIRLRFINQDPRIKAGMFATISLVTNRKVNVPVLNRTSVINTYGSWIVFVVDENNIARRREVTLGLDNEDFVEVLDGVAIGDKVVSAGQNFLSDGDFVRIVE
jgi:multidrug efflux pump subunit AcrA (membrane-fusion protein)